MSVVKVMARNAKPLDRPHGLTHATKINIDHGRVKVLIYLKTGIIALEIDRLDLDHVKEQYGNCKIRIKAK